MSDLTDRLWASDAASALTNEAARRIEALEKVLSPVARLDMWTESADDGELVLMTVGTIRAMRSALGDQPK